MIAIDVIGTFDDVCVEMLGSTLATAIASEHDVVVNVDGLDFGLAEGLRSFASVLRKTRAAGVGCTVSSRNRRVRAGLIRAGCGDLLLGDQQTSAATRRVIIARHLATPANRMVAKGFARRR